MANTEMIRDYIRASGYKMQYVARALKISPNALNLKLQGRTQFKLSEAERTDRWNSGKLDELNDRVNQIRGEL